MVRHADSMASQPTDCVRRGSLWKRHFLKHLSRGRLFRLRSTEEPTESAPGFLASRSTRLRPWRLRDDPLRSTRPRFPVRLGSVPPAPDGEWAAPNTARAAPLPRTALQWRGFLEKGSKPAAQARGRHAAGGETLASKLAACVDRVRRGRRRRLSRWANMGPQSWPDWVSRRQPRDTRRAAELRRVVLGVTYVTALYSIAQVNWRPTDSLLGRFYGTDRRAVFVLWAVLLSICF